MPSAMVTATIIGGAERLESAAERLPAASIGQRFAARPRRCSTPSMCWRCSTSWFFTRDDLDPNLIGPNSQLGTYTNFVNLLDLCGLAVPTRARSDWLPGGVMLLAASGQAACWPSSAGRWRARLPAAWRHRLAGRRSP